MKDKERGITIIGHVDHHVYATSLLAERLMNEQRLKVITARAPLKEPDLIIGGIGYVRHDEATRQAYNRLAGIESLIAQMSVCYPLPKGNRTGPSNPPKVNIISEFELIQQKKSNLSRSEREWVVKQFNKAFKRLEP